MSEYRRYGQGDDVLQDEGDFAFVGVNARLSPEKLGPGVLANAVNVRLRDGEAKTRLGVIKPGWVNVTHPGIDATIGPVTTLNGGGLFKDPQSIEWTLLASDGLVFRCRPHNVRSSIPLPDGVKVLSPCTFIQAFNQVFLFRGRFLQPLMMPDMNTGFIDVEPRWNPTKVYNAAVTVTGQVAEEMAYGPFLSAAITSADDWATVATAGDHGYVTGADVVIMGATPSTYNGRWNIEVIDTRTFRYQFAGGTSPAIGTPIVSNMGKYWKALGSRVDVSTLIRSGTTATVTTASPHGFEAGQYVTITGATPAEFNGTYLIDSADTLTLTYTLPADPGSDATGTMQARTSVVLAGQSPDSNPEAWQQLYNVLPNADDAVFVNNRLLVPTAYTPGKVDYDATSTYAKKDFIVATDIQDFIHFDFANAFRINEGSDDEIVCAVKYNQDTVIVFKEKSWGILSGVAFDLSLLSLDMHGDGYGACAPRSAVVAGKNVLFPSTKRGVCSLRQNELGQTRSVDTPFSNDFQRVIDRINWNLADRIRTAWWNDCLYVAVPLDDGRSTRELAPAIVPAAPGSGFLPGAVPIRLGVTYHIDPGNCIVSTDTAVAAGVPVPGGEILQLGDWTSTCTTLYFWGDGKSTSTVSIREARVGNNAILVYDFRLAGNSSDQSGQWVGYDTGGALCVKEWFKAQWNGLERLFFLGDDGFVSMMEEAEAGDQVGVDKQLGHPNNLAYEEIAAEVDSRGYRLNSEDLKRWRRLQAVMAVWNCEFDLDADTGAAGTRRTVKADVSFSRTKYLKPVGRPDYVEGNINNDFAQPGRGNYSVRLLDSGIKLGKVGTDLSLFQEIIARAELGTLQGRWTQLKLTNRTGRISLKSISPVGAEQVRRSGILIG